MRISILFLQYLNNIDLRPLFISLLVLTFFSCKDSKQNESAEILVEIPEEFVDFYNKFHDDSLYQMDHIVFPLKEKEDGSLWYPEEWSMNRPVDLGDDYIRELDNFEGIITEAIIHKRGFFSLERRFSKMSNGYNLIYYRTRSSFGEEENE